MKHLFARHIALFLALCLAPAMAAGQSTIMPLGDSITEGLCSRDTHGACVNPYTGDPERPGTNAYVLAHYRSNATFCGAFAQRMAQAYNPDATGGYRAPLLRLLRGAGIAATYVGSLHGGTELDNSDRAHEGHGGWQAEHLDYCAPQYVARTLPDVVLLYVGANDLAGQEDVDDTARHILSMEDAITSYAPATRLVIGLNARRFDYEGATPVVDEAYEARRRDLAAKVADQSGYDTPCQARNLADMATMEPGDFTPEPGSGGLHPNEQGYSRMAAIWFHSLTGEPCKMDTRVVVTIGGVVVESITGYGRYWNFGMDGTLIGKGTLDTPDIPRFAAICEGQDVCRFDTRTFVVQGEGIVESITARGRIWDFNLDGTLDDARDLVDVAAYRDGPCRLAPAGDPCTFDTRTVAAQASGESMVETVTAYGWRFDFDPATGRQTSAQALASAARYAPVCAVRPDFQAACAFETRTVTKLPGIRPVIESITAYGRYWNLDAATGTLIGMGNLRDVAHFQETGNQGSTVP